MTTHWKQKLGTTAAATLSILLCAAFLLPVAWMVATSLKSTDQIFAIPPTWSFEPTFEHYERYLGQARIVSRYLNTIIVSIGASVLSVLVGAMCGYALARLRLRGATVIATLILVSRAIPPIALVVPMYLLFRPLGLLDKHLTLIVTYTTFLVPYVVWLSRGFFLALPTALEDAALVDGCSRLGAFFRIILPTTLPGLAATMIFCMILAWNELLFALILTNRDAVTIPVSLSGLAADTEQGALWGPLTAIGTLTVVPIIIFAMAVQKYLVTGLAAGATSGASN